jgi:hypothetical protein
VDELTKMVKSLFAEMDKMNMEGKKEYKGPQNDERKGGFRRPNNITSRLCKERGEETEKTRKFRPLFKTILSPRGKKGKHMSLILKSIASGTLLLFLISLNQHTRSLSWTVT